MSTRRNNNEHNNDLRNADRNDHHNDRTKDIGERLKNLFEDTMEKAKNLGIFQDWDFLKDEPLWERLGEVSKKSVAIEKQIMEVVSAIGYDDEAHFIKDFTRSNAKSVADLVSETWADCMCFSECHKMLSSIPCPIPLSAVLSNMGLGQNSYLSRFAPHAYKTSLELFQLNRSLENTDNTEVPKIGSRCAEKLQPLPDQAVAYLGSELAALADEFNRWSHEFCAFVEGMAACDGQWDSLRREVKSALLCLHQLQITFIHSEALWSKRIDETLSED